MKIPVHHITEQGYKVEIDQEPWFVQAAQDAVGGTLLSAKGSFSLTRQAQRVSIQVSYRLKAKMPCMRCAYGISLCLQKDHLLHYEPLSEDETREEIELAEEDLDIGWYEEGKIDLSVVLCEAVTLDLPMVIHCANDFVTDPNPQGCLQESKIEESTLENLFVDLFKTQ